MTVILTTIIVALATAFVLGVLLGLFKKVFAVEVDPTVEAVREALSGANCGGCGYAGCDAFAAAVAAGEAPAGGCVAGGADVAQKIAAILGVESSGGKKQLAFIACHGTTDCAPDKGAYNGVRTCRAACQAVNGTKKCAFGCAGFGDCVAACPFGALTMGADGLPAVDRATCVGCKVCMSVCPAGAIYPLAWVGRT